MPSSVRAERNAQRCSARIFKEVTTRRTPKWEQTRAGVGDSRDSTVLADPSRDATVDARHLRRPSGLTSGNTVGRYTILSIIGRGGMGTVYAAHDPKLDRKVALKVLHDEHIADGAERLVREAQALARLADPHVVTIFDAGEIDGHVYLAMQLVDGQTLAEALERDPSVAQILAWFVEAGKGLMAAHAVGLVHRDFKPSNVLIDRKRRSVPLLIPMSRGNSEPCMACEPALVV